MSKNNKTVVVYMSPELLKRLDKYMSDLYGESHNSRSAIVERAVREFLDREGAEHGLQRS